MPELEAAVLSTQHAMKKFEKEEAERSENIVNGERIEMNEATG